MPETYEYKTEKGRTWRRATGTSGGYWQPVGEEASAKSTAAVKSDLGYKSGGDDSEDLSDEAISKMSPLMQASARARRKAKASTETDTQRSALAERRKAGY